jgi:hypothetical protein
VATGKKWKNVIFTNNNERPTMAERTHFLISVIITAVESFLDGSGAGFLCYFSRRLKHKHVHIHGRALSLAKE